MSNFDEESYARAIKARVRFDYQGKNAPPSLHIAVMAGRYQKTEQEIIADLEAATPPKRPDEPQPTYD